MSVSVRYTPNNAAIRATKSRNGIIGGALVRVMNKVVVQAKRNVTSYGRVKTGRMRSEIRAADIEVRGSEVVAEVIAEAEYSVFQHQGTSRGISPAPFLTDALRDVGAGDFHR